jgi:hypothetical protein
LTQADPTEADPTEADPTEADQDWTACVVAALARVKVQVATY